ncbi:MAG TPA: hypothetical protein VL418_01575 [Devosiaceae bacterium]|nr:hypothetical protein [Devosiaceae bacterium]
MQPINRRIGGWQLNVARLIALGRKAHSNGTSAERLRAETEALFAEVHAERRALSERQRNLPAAVANSSRMIDTARALRSLSKGLEQALEMLPPQPRDRGGERRP